MGRHLLVSLIVAGFTATTWILAVGKAAQDVSTEPSMEELMAAVMRYGMPGPSHEGLSPLAGDWSMEGRHRRSEADEWTTFKARARTQWILGSRFLSQTVQGEPTAGMPQTYEGLSLLGYDVQRAEYTYLYLDNFSTAMHLYRGKRDSNGVIDLKSSVLDPITGKPRPVRATFHVQGPDEYRYRDYGTAVDGTEYVSVEITYRRQTAGE